MPRLKRGGSDRSPEERRRPAFPPNRRRGIGARIKSARLNAGLTQRDLAKKLAVSAGAVGQWETGGIPATERLSLLAGVLGVSLDWLLGNVTQTSAAGVVAGTQTKALSQPRGEAGRREVDPHMVVSEARQQRWIEENRGALADANAFLARHGLWSDGKRQF